MKKKCIAVSCIVVFVVCCFSGCQEGHQEKKIQYIYPTHTLDLHPEGIAALDAAGQLYDDLSLTHSLEQTRQVFINELNQDFPFITQAFLGEDGYTIFIKFDDGTVAFFMTDDGFFPDPPTREESSSGIEYGYRDTAIRHPKKGYEEIRCEPVIMAPYRIPAVADDPIIWTTPARECGELDVMAPKTKNVLIICASTITDPYYSDWWINETTILLLRQGWTMNDITIKKRNYGRDKRNLTIEDLLDYSDYGLVIYLGRSGHLEKHPHSLPGTYYIQATAAGNYSTLVSKERWKQIIEWFHEGRLVCVYFKDKELNRWRRNIYMDIGLISEQGKIDRGTLVYFASVKSWKIQQEFMTIGAGNFMGWDGQTDFLSCHNAFTAILKGMEGNGNPKTDEETFAALSPDILTSPGLGNLRLATDPPDTYLPAWATISMTPSSIPPGLDEFRIKITPITSPYISVYLKAGETKECKGLIPVQSTFYIVARGPDLSVLDSGIVTVDIHCGPNTIQITSWETYGIVLDADPKQVAADGIQTSQITATVRKWKSSDILMPTGDPIPYKCIEFRSTLGFLDSYLPMTDKNGEAIVHLASTEEGVATVRAFVTDELLEATKTCTVHFGSYKKITLSAEKNLLDVSPGRTTHDTTIITALVTDSEGNPVKDCTVYFEPEAFLTGTNPAKTDAQGKAEITYSFPASGETPNPTSWNFREEKSVTASFDGIRPVASLPLIIDAIDWVTLRLSGSPEHDLTWNNPNTTFEAKSIEIKLAVNDGNRYPVWQTGGASFIPPNQYYARNFSARYKRGSALNFYFIHYGDSSYIQNTYLHMFNSWDHYVIALPAFSGVFMDPDGQFTTTIP